MIQWMNSGKTNAHATRQEEINDMVRNVLWLKVDSPVLTPPQPDLPTWPKEKDIKGALYELNYCGEYDHAEPSGLISAIPIEQPYFYYGIDPSVLADHDENVREGRRRFARDVLARGGSKRDVPRIFLLVRLVQQNAGRRGHVRVRRRHLVHLHVELTDE